MSEKKKNNLLVVKAICFAVIIVIICVFVWFLTHQDETHYSISEDDVKTSVLQCKSSSPENPFFVSEKAQRNDHELKFVFKDDKLDQVSYDYNSVYNSEGVAADAEAKMHTAYIEFMKKINVNKELLSPNFSPVKQKLKMSLYWDLAKGIGAVSPIFFMTSEEYNTLNKSGLSDVKKMYEKKGFSCTISD